MSLMDRIAFLAMVVAGIALLAGFCAWLADGIEEWLYHTEERPYVDLDPEQLRRLVRRNGRVRGKHLRSITK